jgi:hypothetical protein
VVCSIPSGVVGHHRADVSKAVAIDNPQKNRYFLDLFRCPSLIK